MSVRLTLRNGIRIAPRLVLACLGMSALALADGSGGGALRAGPAFANDVEGSLVRAIVGLREHGMKQAMGEIDGILDRTPNFRLGHLVKGDMLMARAASMAFVSWDPRGVGGARRTRPVPQRYAPKRHAWCPLPAQSPNAMHALGGHPRSRPSSTPTTSACYGDFCGLPA